MLGGWPLTKRTGGSLVDEAKCDPVQLNQKEVNLTPVLFGVSLTK